MNHAQRMRTNFVLPKCNFNKPYRRIGKSKELFADRVVSTSCVEEFDFKVANPFKASDFVLENLIATGSLASLSLPSVGMSRLQASDRLDYALDVFESQSQNS